MMQWTKRFMLLTGILLVVLGASGGIIYPVLRSARSGEIVFSEDVPAHCEKTLSLAPQMNPIRVSHRVTYNAPARRLSGNASTVKAKLSRASDELEVWSLQTGFSDDDPNRREETVRAGLEHRTTPIQEFVIDTADDYLLIIDLNLDDSFQFETAEVEVRRNVQPLDWQQVVVGSSMMVVGIFVILAAAFWMLRGRK